MSADGAALRIIALLDELADLKFDVERLEKAVDVLAASVNAATIRAEKAEAAIERVRARCEYVDILDASEYDAGRMAALDAVLAALDGGESA